jgi:hypothetical protein
MSLDLLVKGLDDLFSISISGRIPKANGVVIGYICDIKNIV